MTNDSDINTLQHNYTPPSLIKEVYLTKREADVLYHLVRGKTAKLIADLLNISRRTVEYHLKNIKSRFKVKTKSELIEKILGDSD